MKRMVSALLTFCMVCMYSLPGAAAANYSDTAGHWAQTQIDQWSAYGIIQGDNGAFRPDDPITRGEMAVILDRIMDYQQMAENTFTDLGNAFYTESILKASASGVILGDGSMVRPGDPITRQEAAVMLGRALGLEQGGSLSQFSDSAEIAGWAKGFVGALAERKFVSGSGGAFHPNAPITRAETVTILHNAIEKLVKSSDTVTGDVENDVIVQASGAVLENMTVQGDLILAEGIGEGEVTLNNVTIEGRVIVRGGGMHSVLFNSVRVNGGLVVNKLDGRVRIVTSGNSNITVTTLQSGAMLVGDGFASVVIPADMIKGQTVELNGTFARVENHSADVVLKAEGTIKELVADVSTNVLGDHVKIQKQTTTNGSSITVNGKAAAESKPAGGSSGGSGGGGGHTSETTYGISLDTNVLTLRVGESAALKATATLPEGADNTIYWLSSDTSVVTVDKGMVTAVGTGAATVTAHTENKTYQADCSVTVTKQADTELEPGWNDATHVDARFADGYPVCSSDKGEVTVQFGVKEASPEHPVDVYLVVSEMNSGTQADTASVVHGHVGVDEVVYADGVMCYTLQDAEIATLNTGVKIQGNQDIDVFFVLSDDTGLSAEPTRVSFGKTVVNEVDQEPLELNNRAYINAARDKIYLHTQDEMDLTSCPDISAFSIEGIAGAQISSVRLGESASHDGYVELTVSGITAESGLTSAVLHYQKPVNNPLQDRATTPNPSDDFTVNIVPATVTLASEDIHISQSGQYIHLCMSNAPYLPDRACELDIEVRYGTSENDARALQLSGDEYEYATNGTNCDYWREVQGELELVPGSKFYVYVTPQNGTYDYAFDAVETIVSEGIEPKTPPQSIVSACYNADSQEITVKFSRETVNPAPCAFTIQANGKEYVVREGFGGGTEAVLRTTSLPLTLENGAKIKYEPRHENMTAVYGLVTSLAGEPMENSGWIDITFE